MPERKAHLDHRRGRPHRAHGARGAGADYEITGVDIRPSEAHPQDAVADMTDIDAIRPLFRDRTSSSTSRTTRRAT